MALAPALLLWIAAAAAAAPGTPAAPKAVQILSDAVLPAELNRAIDVRWASDGTVYLALGSNGVGEFSLDPPGRLIRELIPGRFKPGGFRVSHQLAASPRFLVAASSLPELTWRRLDDQTRFEEVVEGIQAIDLWRDRVLIVGARRGEKREFAPDGAIAWIGTLGKQLADLKPLLYAVSGPGAREVAACGVVHLGAARFFADGSFVLLPGVQPGLSFFDRDGKLLRVVDTPSLGIDSDCASMTQEQRRLIGLSIPDRLDWLNQRRTVDTLLVLPQGPGLLVRSIESGRVRWRLGIVKPGGTVESYRVPIDAPDEFYHLRGDVRSGKVVFLLYQTHPRGGEYAAQPRLLTALVPEG